MTKRQFELDPELLKAMECERQVEDNLARIRICARAAAEVSEKLLHCAASEKLRAGFVPSQIAAWLRAAADRIEANGVGDPPTEMGCDAMGSSGGDLTMLDTTPITTEFTGLISTGTTKQALLAAVARKFPELTTAELSVALQDATAQAERHAARKH